MLQQSGALRSPHDAPGTGQGLKPPKLGERTYRGQRLDSGENRVWIETVIDRDRAPERGELALHLEVRNHSPTGFGWGYGGSGPAQLALALLMDALGDANMAREHYQQFKRDHVARWDTTWSITAEDIQFYVLSKVTREPTAIPPRFAPGTVVMTQGVQAAVSPPELMAALRRHLSGDWGELGEEDWKTNEAALRLGERLLSAYNSASGQRFWIITEADRSSTTALLPEEY
jgi:Family of unknown function (DUF6166)